MAAPRMLANNTEKTGAVDRGVAMVIILLQKGGEGLVWYTMSPLFGPQVLPGGRQAQPFKVHSPHPDPDYYNVCE
jgi:hypothetical protein